MTLLAQASNGPIENAALEALRQAPGIIAVLVMTVLFLRYLTDCRKADHEERKEQRETMKQQSDAVKELAVVVGSLKDNIKK